MTQPVPMSLDACTVQGDSAFALLGAARAALRGSVWVALNAEQVECIQHALTELSAEAYPLDRDQDRE